MSVKAENFESNSESLVDLSDENLGAASGLKRLIDLISLTTGFLTGLGIITIMLIVCYEVISRYIFNSPTSWVTEYSLYTFICTSFLGASYATLKGSHIRVEVFLNLVSSPTRLFLKKVSVWLSLIIVTVSGWQMVIYTHREYSGGIKGWDLIVTPLWIPQSIVAFGFLVFAGSVFGEARGLSGQLSRNREMASIGVMIALALVLFVLGDRPPNMLDFGLLAIVFSVLTIALLWNGGKVVASVLVLLALGALLFFSAKGQPALLQGAALLFYVLLLFAMGVRIAFALGLTGALAVFFLLPAPQLIALPEKAWSNVNNFTFTAMPMFILMGAFLLRGGVSESLFSALLKWVGRFPGGIGHTTVVASGIFSAVSGSSLATAATMGMVACPEMTKRGYSQKLTYGVVAAGGTLGILIPPSIAFVIYGSLTGEAIDKLFIAGIVPGIFLMTSFMIVIGIWAFVSPGSAPRGSSSTWSEKLYGLKGVLPFILLIAGVLGTMYIGIATPTEAGAIGAFLAAFLTFLYRKLTVKMAVEAAMEAANVTSFIIIIVAFAGTITYAMDYIRLPQELVSFIQDANLSRGTVIFSLVVIYIVLGMFIDAISMMIITLPIALPVIYSLGLDPIWFGVVLVMMLEIGMVTPPVGVILFILKGIGGDDVELKDIVLGVFPFVVMFLLNILLFSVFPEIVLWLPNLMK